MAAQTCHKFVFLCPWVVLVTETSWDRTHPQETEFPVRTLLNPLKQVLPQSHLNSQTTHRLCLLSVGLIATNLPYRCPVMSRAKDPLAIMQLYGI